MTRLTIATRGSKLALWQAEHIKARIEERHKAEVDLLVLKTKGDIILDVPLAKVGGKGLFVKEIEEALLDGRADIAVHSMKDVPMELPEGLVLGAVPEREVSADVLLSVHFGDITELPHGAKVGTSSLRRQAQILMLRPDLKVHSIRGNVETRIRKLMDGEFDAIIMAAAGMRRLRLTTPHMYPLKAPAFLPAAGQGALGIEYKKDRQDLVEMLAFLNHEETFTCVTAERAFLAALEGGCQVPIAAYAEFMPASAGKRMLRLDGLVADVSGERCIRKQIEGSAEEAAALGASLAQSILAAGGGEILRELYQADA